MWYVYRLAMDLVCYDIGWAFLIFGNACELLGWGLFVFALLNYVMWRYVRDNSYQQETTYKLIRHIQMEKIKEVSWI
jgi:hypothetical protein